MNLEKEVFDISIDDIMPNRFQPREMFDEEKLEELSTSIKEHGIIEPIIVRKVGDKYEIIAGERRYRATKKAGLKTIPALVKDMDDKEAAKVALLENLQREDLTPIEEAKTYQTILKLDNLTQEELAQNLGKSQSAVANKLRLLQLDEEVQTALLNNKISERHARSLLEVKEKEKQRQLLQDIITNRWTVKQLDDEIEKALGITKPKPVAPPQEETQTPIELSQDVPNIPSPKQAPAKAPEEENIDENIFNKLRVDIKNSEEQPVSTTQPVNVQQTFNYDSPTVPVNPTIENPYGDVYDLRFAINNVRQAVQNTKKFGFSIETEEFDFENVYQIVIKIDKDKENETI